MSNRQRKKSAANGFKKQNQEAHAIKRIRERYGFKLDHRDYKNLCGLIKQKDGSGSEYIGKQSNRLTLHRLTYRDTTLVVVYDRIRHQVVTALPPDCKELQDYADQYNAVKS